MTDAKNCSDAKTVNVNVAFPIAEFGSDQMSSVGNTPITLDPASTTAVSYLWTNVTTGATLGNSTTLTVDSSGKYAVLVQDINGCTNSDTVTVFFVEGSPYVIYVPNVFSPSHSDPDNRALKVYGNLIKTNDFSFRIYNKWGDLIYETKDFSEANSIGWTGDMASSQQQMNVFTYTVKGEFFDGTPFEKVGTATLIK